MHIKEIIVEGFKSYAQRTVIGTFDPLFNAITGLNGSGKSNILDSICFVLGISNLSQVRAGSLQELVYKQGQAGVTKASVSIVFDNSDKSQSPVGYEQYDEITVTRQVVIGGKNKYLINGHNAQPGRVQNLFHSIQLNVNNPHFLIMQGRITKVLNMKPPEILSMIEEAAGTRMFETKKIAALKTIEKKDNKLEEIQKVLTEEITPTLEKLRKDRSSYLDYQKAKMELDTLVRFVTAHEYMQAETLVKNTLTEISDLNASLIENKAIISKSDIITADLKSTIRSLEQRRDVETGGALKDTEQFVADLSKELVKVNAAWSNKKDTTAAEEKQKTAILKSIKETQQLLSQKEKEIKEFFQKSEARIALFNQLETAYQEKERMYEALSTGISDDKGGKTYGDQLKDAQAEASAIETEIKQLEMKLTHNNAEIAKKKPLAKSSEKDYTKMKSNVESVSREMAQMEKDLQSLQFNPEQEASLQLEYKANLAQINALKNAIEEMRAKVSAIRFDYRDPEPGFDRSKVFGVVAELIKINDVRTSTAIEVTAGGKLYNVVVDSDETGKKLLTKGQLKRRVTIIPLNKIASTTLSSSTLQHAEQLVGKGNAQLALSLVGYNEEIEAAMKYVFGTTLICKDMDIASKVTFNDKIKARSVTYDGDVFDPHGTVSGGSRDVSANVLMQLSELHAQEERLRHLEETNAQIEATLQKMSKNAKTYAALKNALDLKSHEAKLLQKQMEQSSCHQIVSEVLNMEQAMKDDQAAIEALTKKEKDVKKKCVAIAKEMDQFASQRDAKLAEMKKEVAKAKTALQNARADGDTLKQEHESLKMEAESLKQEIVTFEQQLKACEDGIVQLKKDEESFAIVVAEKKKEYDTQAHILAQKKQKLNALDEDIQEMNNRLENAIEAKNEAEVALKKIDHKLTRLQKENKDAMKQVEFLLAQHSWINSEKQFFDKPGTEYESKKGDPHRDPVICRKRMHELQTSQDKLSKSVNMKVLAMFGKAEKEYNDLIKKKKIVEGDKAKIAQAIEDLDKKKNEALKKAYDQVNRDFGSIFSTLLPGTKAQLQPVEGQSVLDGLQVRVAFGQVWKESLTELSGGQRSLVALSLILALLLFKPAPLYILDEVDAALDLSHTQNIGQMLRTHFNKSQFIVVSLKDGMFNNANVLFKTKFVDGVSTVRRFQQRAEELDAVHGAKQPKKASKKQKLASIEDDENEIPRMGSLTA